MERLCKHLRVLEMEDMLDIWVDTRIKTGDDLSPEIEQALTTCRVAILLVTVDFLTSGFIRSKEVPKLLQRRSDEGVTVFPVICKPCTWEPITWLSSMKLRPKDASPLMGMSKYKQEKELKQIALDVAEIVKNGAGPSVGTSAPPRIFLSKLPSTTPKLFGRDGELKMLDEVWEDPHKHIIMLSAWGGVGKSSLVDHWLKKLQHDSYRGAERVYGWSFYSQGTGEDRQAGADEFFAHALDWFGDPDPTKVSPWEKGERLAGLIMKRHTLLILDGLEPVQYPTGRLRDQGMEALLNGLARAGSDWGLCIISTRLPVPDLLEFNVPLDNLSDEAGAQLLRERGVAKECTDEELREASRDFQGHALALTLLGSYIAAVHDGDIRKRGEIPDLLQVPDENGRQARRVMKSYIKFLKGTPELDILYLMGLFDRPADSGAMKVLRAKPKIKGLTDSLCSLTHAQWQFALKGLRDLRLLDQKDALYQHEIDCHPLIREHFGEALKKEKPAAWKEANNRLYEYFKSLPKKDLPDTLDEMEPLYRAVAHGCRAGRYQEALDEVYWARICRGNQYYSTKKLGAFGADLAALSGFFEELWSQPVAALSDSAKAIILNLAGFHLRALGRLREALAPMQAALEMGIKQKDWKNDARGAGNLSELSLTLGDVSEAVDYARQSVAYADRSGDDFQRMSDRAALADALHQAGKTSEAHDLFVEAETMQKKRQPEYQFLYSVWGFWFCNLLLSQGHFQQVQKRAVLTLQWGTKEGLLLDIALNHLCLGRATVLQLQKEGIYSELKKAADESMNQAVQRLREAGQQEFLFCGLLARAEFHRITADYEEAWRDLNEAKEIAQRGEMKLHLTNYHLEAARLCLAQGNKTDSRTHLNAAKKLIEQTGYNRRLPELEDLNNQLN